MGSAQLCKEEPYCSEKPQSELLSQPARISSEDDGRTSSRLEYVVYGPDSGVTGFEALQNEWNNLLKRSRFDTVFLTHEWLSTWWDYLGEGKLWILAFRNRDDGQLVGITPFYLTGVESNEVGSFFGTRTFSIVGCIEVSDYLDLIIAEGWEGEVYAALLDWLYSDDAPEWDVVDLCNLPQDSLTYVEFPPLAEATGASVNVLQEDVAPQIQLPLRFESYLEEQVDKKQRHEIRRKMRRAEREANIGFHIVTADENLAAEVDDFIALQQASREDKADFMTPQMRRFFNAMAQRMMDAGWLQLSFVTVDGDKAAALLAFEYENRYLLYNSGYDPDAHAHLSPGWVQLSYAIQYAIAIGCDVFDFMQGDEEYKYRFGSQDYKVMRVLMERKR